MCVCVCTYIDTYNPQLCPLKGSGSCNISGAMNTPNAQILVSKSHSPPKGNQSSMAPQLLGQIQGWGQQSTK